MKANEQSIDIPMTMSVTITPKLKTSAGSIYEFIYTNILFHYQGHFTELMAGYSSYEGDIGLTHKQSATAFQGQRSVTTRNEDRSPHSDDTRSTVQQSKEIPGTVTPDTPTDLPFDARESVQAFGHHGVWSGASLQGSYGSGDSTNNKRGGDLSQSTLLAVSTPWNRAT